MIEEVIFQEQDLRILKALTSNQKLALEFINSCDPKLFLGNSKDIGSLICNYIQTYKTTPTQRVLLDKAKNNTELQSKIGLVFNQLNDIQFDSTEYSYDLEKFKQKFIDTKFKQLQEGFKSDSLDHEQVLNSVDSIV